MNEQDWDTIAEESMIAVDKKLLKSIKSIEWQNRLNVAVNISPRYLPLLKDDMNDDVRAMVARNIDPCYLDKMLKNEHVYWVRDTILQAIDNNNHWNKKERLRYLEFIDHKIVRHRAKNGNYKHSIEWAKKHMVKWGML